MARHTGKMHESHKKEIRDLSAEIMRLARSTLLINLRFLESAFLHVHPDPDLTSATMSTEGYFLHYNPAFVCRYYATEPTVIARDYLHVVLHCLYRHFYVGRNVRKNVWDLACDIQVEHEITGLGIRSLESKRTEEQEWLTHELQKNLPALTAERIYRYFMDEKIPDEDVVHLRSAFLADDHELWYTENSDGDENARKTGDQSSEDRESDDGRGASSSGVSEEGEGADGGQESDEMTSDEANALQAKPEAGASGGKAGGQEDSDADEPTLLPTPEERRQNWTEISERIQIDLDTFSDSYGSGTGDMKQSLRELNRERYDYADFLKKFASLGENLQTNDDEFDYIYYEYGLEHYGDMPLIEPLEYKEVKKVREFVIAIDTSESVSGDLVQEFVQKTWNLMKQTDNFFSTVNVHIMQCGARVEEDVKITNQDEFDAYMRRMVLKGFGGTDFRPVFEKVQELINSHEFVNFKGLIYFTDGYGTYPAMPPDYDTAFVFVDRGQEMPEVPPWAMKVVLSEEEIHAMEGATES